MALSYNISEKLGSYLSVIDKLRQQIVMTPLSPKVEMRLKWDANLEKIYWAMSLIDESVSKAKTANTLSNISNVSKKKLTNVELDTLNLRKTFGYIKEDWLAVNTEPTIATLKKLYELSCRQTLGKMTGLTEYSEKRIETLLTYLNKGADHPVIQAGIVQVETVNITPFDTGNTRVARLLSYLYLYKNGYDVREMISFEEAYRRDMATFKQVTSLSRAEGNLTLWLEYFAFCVMTSLEKTSEIIKNQKFNKDVPASFWKLNPRQKQILYFLENPDMKITNKDVQKMYGVSQITASRDLTALTTLGLLFARGKGRSVFYTKV